MPSARVLAYAAALTEELIRMSNGQVCAAYLHGSAALGGWLPSSDVDILFIATDDISSGALDLVARSLADSHSACPGRGLECSVVSRSAAAGARPPWPYLLHVVTGSAEPAGSRTILGADSPGDTDLLMHYAVCRAAGWPVSGPPPRELIGPVARQHIRAYMADELRWGLEHATEAYAVLNSCRALIYLADGRIVSKVAGGEAALRRGLGPAGLIQRTLAQQQGRAAEQQPGAEAAAFVLATAGALNDAANGLG
jgi:streptomycin 3"-adenylyltransferase